MKQAESFQFVLGYVEDVDVEGNRVYITDSFGRKHNVPIYPRRGGGPIPRVNEQWVLDRSMGELAFHSMLTANPSSVTNLDDLVEALEAMGFIVDELVPGGGGDHDHDADYSAIVHTHDADDVISGTIAIGRLPVGTSASDVAAGDHLHDPEYQHIVDASEPASPIDGLLWTNPDETFAAPASGLQRILYFEAAGSPHTFTKADYPGLRAVRVKCVGSGAGGSGAGATDSGDFGSAGAGGGGGAYAEALLLVSELGADETVTVGEGGAGGEGDSDGSNGEDSSFGSHCIADGGHSGGRVANSGAGAADGGVGGLASSSTGDLTVGGDDGESAYVNGDARQYAGGGGGTVLAGRGRGEYGGNNIGAFSSGQSGDGPGAGGGGTGRRNNRAAGNGSDGIDGIVIVELYY